MKARQFLSIARRLAERDSEEDWRSAVSRAYYAVFHECLDAIVRWGLRPPKTDVHKFVSSVLCCAPCPALNGIGRLVAGLCNLRRVADYVLDSEAFQRPQAARNAVRRAKQALAHLEGIESQEASVDTVRAAVRVWQAYSRLGKPIDQRLGPELAEGWLAVSHADQVAVGDVVRVLPRPGQPEIVAAVREVRSPLVVEPLDADGKPTGETTTCYFHDLLLRRRETPPASAVSEPVVPEGRPDSPHGADQD
jgi:flavin-binding protein dodecin